MRNNAFTLTELVMVIVISTIVVCAIGFNLVAANYFRATTQDNVEISREARIAINHMTRVLRFAKVSEPITAGSNSITANIEGGRLSFITADTPVAYTRNVVNDTLEYTQGATTQTIAGGGQRSIDITYFDGIWNNATKEMTIKITAEKGGRSVSIQTRILAMGS
jgi:prepilin-type N-terminal cleavage/methylation domain-containing protein